MSKIVASFNCGGLGPNNIPSQVKTNILNTMYTIRAKHKKYPDFVLIQETGNDEFRLAPIFGGPLCIDTNFTLTTPQNKSIRRGVSTYADEKSTIVIPITDYTNIEACFTIHEYQDQISDNRPPKHRKMALINLYRNQHEFSTCTPEALISFIREQLYRIRNSFGMQAITIIGDFNFEGPVHIEGLIEMKHPAKYHRHNATTGKTWIDRVFTTIKDEVTIIDVLKTVENKQTYTVDGVTKEDLGHKVIVLRFGREQIPNKVIRFTMPSFISNATAWKPEFRVITRETATSADIEELAVYFNTETVKLIEKSKITTYRKPEWSPTETVLEAIEREGENINKQIEAAHRFYNMCEEFMGIVRDDSVTEKPTLIEFQVFSENKLATIGNPDMEVCIEIMGEIYQDRETVNPKFPDAEKFKRIVLSVSNSGAQDYFNISLKHTNIILGRNKDALGLFKTLCEAIAYTGHIPGVWRIDKINFLFKNKGVRILPKFYRPITIAPSYGKHFDKISIYGWNHADDLNYENNAYIAGKDCMSAIAGVQENIRAVRAIIVPDGKIIIIFINCEDISTAFESVPHKVIEHYAEISFEKGDFNMPGIVKSYLDRKSFIYDQETKETIPLRRTNEEQTTPQGSAVSPPNWRVDDGAFTKLYKNYVEKYVEENSDIIIKTWHDSYADDHKTGIAILIDKHLSIEQIRTIILTISNTLREFLDIATKTFGCSVNRDKSEVIVYDHLKDPEKMERRPKFKSQYVWLGQSLKLVAENYLIITENRMKQRFMDVAKKVDDLFQYERSPLIRRKVYMVYVRPTIEWFLPVIMTKSQRELATSNAIEVFQQKMLAKIFGLPSTVSRHALNKHAAEPSVKEKVITIANRLSRHYPRDSKYLQYGNANVAIAQAQPLQMRNRNVVRLNFWKNMDKKDFGDQVTFLQSKILENSTNLKFDLKRALTWAKFEKRKIGNKIRERSATL